VTLLEHISGHDDLIKLNTEDKLQLCNEIRDFLVTNISRTGGHLASNLGVVELSVAIETVFDTRKDRLVFDVGHQSYVHKLLTGRQADFACLRQVGGIAGFPKPSESNTDAFVAGHASSSVSIALGMARARTLQKEDYSVVALLGDGAATGGMIYEGLNDAAESKEPMVIILNDNEMSIDRNVGGMAKHLSRLRTKERYLGMKDRYRDFLARIPGGDKIYKSTRSAKEWLKRVLLPGTIFENMGLTYMGPVDGHDLPELCRVLGVAKSMGKPVLVHVLTHKGHGYKFAEEKPSQFHGVGAFDPDSGEIQSSGKISFSQTFGESMVSLADENDRICAITAAMPGGTGLLPFQKLYPNRLFDVGIAEEHAVSMAGGLAKQGMVPVVALYSTFLQRSYDQLIQDIAMLKLHVVFAVDRAGLVGEDGETHHGVFDVGYLRQVPGMQILCPASCAELTHMLKWAVDEAEGPVAIRYPRGGDGAYTDSAWGKSVCCHREGKDITLITYGTLVNNAMAAAEILSRQGIEATVLRLTCLSPMAAEQVAERICGSVVILEETASSCGIWQSLGLALQEKTGCPVASVNLGDNFVTHGNVQELYRIHGLDPEGIAKFAAEVHGNEN